VVSEKDGMVLLPVPEGEFKMGSNDEDPPLHTVWLDAFWIDRTEVTNALYIKCVAGGTCKPSIYADDNTRIPRQLINKHTKTSFSA
jgi:formylglycine-generating enzyme required for sulfatase activity